MSASGWAGGRATDKQPSHSVKGMAEPHLTKKGAQSASFLVEHVLRPARPYVTAGNIPVVLEARQG